MGVPGSLDGCRCVVVSNLRLAFSIGILEHEKQRPQEVAISIWMFVPEQGPAVSTDIADYVSYADVVEGVKAIAATGRHILLVESLAEEIAAVALADRRVARAIVDVRKTEIVPEAAGVGVIIARENAPQ